MAKRKSTTSRRAKRPVKEAADNESRACIDTRGDAALIRLCCGIVADFAAFRAAFPADPDGNNVNAEKIAYPYLRRATRNAAKAATIKAITVYGLHAKAAATRAAFDDNDGCSLEPHTEALALSLVDDMIRISHQFSEREFAERNAAKAVTS